MRDEPFAPSLHARRSELVPVALGIVRSTALYVFLAFLVCLWLLDVSFADARHRAADSHTFADYFLLTGLWALPVLLLTLVLSALKVALHNLVSTRYRAYGVTVAETVFGGLGYAFINPFHGLRLLVSRHPFETDETGFHLVLSRAWRVFHISWALALAGYLAAGLTAVA